MTLGEIARLVGGDLHGPADLPILGPGSLESPDEGRIVFANSADYLEKAEASTAVALLLSRDLDSKTKPYVSVDNPRVAFLMILKACERPLPISPGIHPTAIVDSSAVVSSQAQVGAYAVIERGAQIEAGARIYPFAYIGEDCVVCEGAVVYPHAVLYQQVTLGVRAVVHAGSVLGADGFGYVWDGKQRIKVPHVGDVEIGVGCEIGALSAIDRATAGRTSIGAGTKIDNFVHIAHNVTLGDDCAVAAFVGISGSTTVGDRVVMAGQVGLRDHITVASDTVLAARAGVVQSIEEPGEYIGMPAVPASEGKRAMLLFARLPELLSRIRKLEKRVGGE